MKIKFYTLYFSEIMVIFNCKERLKLHNKYTDKVMRDEGRDLGLESQIRSNAEKWLKAQGRDEVLSK